MKRSDKIVPSLVFYIIHTTVSYKTIFQQKIENTSLDATFGLIPTLSLINCRLNHGVIANGELRRKSSANARSRGSRSIFAVYFASGVTERHLRKYCASHAMRSFRLAPVPPKYLSLLDREREIESPARPFLLAGNSFLPRRACSREKRASANRLKAENCRTKRRRRMKR